MIGQTLSHYKIVSKLGEGGMGEVYLAEDIELGRQVALKILPQDMAESPERLERFRREARAVASLDHPNIIRIHNIEEADGLRLLVMELVAGESLDKLIPTQGFPLAKAFDIAIPMADALAAAHAKGITHRDLKPANVMMTPEGKVTVLDFGLAKLAVEAAGTAENEGATELATHTAHLTGEGVVMGTAPYMSPEQLQGVGVDHRTDIFSFGIVLYEMLTGQRPFKGSSGIDLASSILKDEPSTVTQVRTDLPRHLGRIINHCLEKDPDERFQTALDVRNELRSLRKEVESGELPTPPSEVAGTSGAFSPPGPTTSGPHFSEVGGTPESGAAAVVSGPYEASPKSRSGIWVAVAAGVVLASLAGWWFGRGDRPADRPRATAAESVSAGAPSIAVLPFADLSPEKDQEYFTDGMTEELLQALGTIEGLKVPSRTAVFALKGKQLDIQEVGDLLGVATVLEGSVRKAGNRLRISTQLVQVSDGFKLWSETYDRELEDVFTVQDEIAKSIALALRITLAPGSQRSGKVGGTKVTEAYDSLLRGNEYVRRQTNEDFEFACQLFQRAIELDPTYALAHARLAACNLSLYETAGNDPVRLDTAREAISNALELAPDLAEAHVARAGLLVEKDLPEEAVREFDAAVALAPRNAETYWRFGRMLFQMGDLERTADLWEKSIELDPDDRRPMHLLPQVYKSLGRTSELEAANRRALDTDQRYLQLNPDDYNARIFVASTLMNLGRRDEAFEEARQVIASGTDDTLVLYNTACFFSLAGEVDQAFQALEQAVDAGDRDIAWWRQDSDLDNLRDDPRFDELLARMESGG